MTIHAQTVGTTSVLSMAGSMRGHDFGELHSRLVDLLRSRRKRIVLDFSGVEHVSYRDATSLAREFDVVRSYDGNLMLTGLSAYVRSILLFAGLSGVLETNTLDPRWLDGPRLANEPRAS